VPTCLFLRNASLNRELSRAVDANDAPAVFDLLQRGADPNAAVYKDARSLWGRLLDGILHHSPPLPRETIMLQAAYWFRPVPNGGTIDNMETIELLADAGANVNVRMPDGRSPLIAVTAFGKAGSLKVLLDHRADVGVTDETGDTALHIAASTLRQDMALMLLQHRADLNARNHKGVSPLISALEHYIGESEIDKARTRSMGAFLLLHGASLEGQSQDGIPLRKIAKLYRDRFHDRRVNDLIKGDQRSD
jgi:ankyrin repeat protein